MSSPVLDASAVLALLNSEPGADAVASTLPGALVCTVNLAEVVSKLADHGVPTDALRPAIQGLGLRLVGFNEDMAFRAGALRTATRAAGLALGDRACLALAQAFGTKVLTADRTWAGLELDLEIEVIR